MVEGAVGADNFLRGSVDYVERPSFADAANDVGGDERNGVKFFVSSKLKNFNRFSSLRVPHGASPASVCDRKCV